MNRVMFAPKNLNPSIANFDAPMQKKIALPASIAGNRGKTDAFRAHFPDRPGKANMQVSEERGKMDLDVNTSTSSSLCPHCQLPMGDFGYYGIDGKGSEMIHGECMAQQMLQELKEEEDKRQVKDEEEKQLSRRQYNIGWRVEHIPRNMGLQEKLKGMLVSHGLCCLVLQKDSKTVRLAPTVEPSAAVNLEYLSLALQVRRKEGREPLFSLDPVQRTRTEFDKESSQVKRFVPEWLAGTSVGEVLFQADYHLKELSMGEYEQPVVGMKSCFDYSEEEDVNKKWSAREWFMVRKAEVQLSEDNVLVPQVKMGIEAREQVYSAQGLEDAPITRKNHPMVKYADAFTKNFDLIAERKSVVYHLRELAKASVLAKFLVDAKIEVEESWFNLAGEVEEACAMEIPQLWNERLQSKIRVKDGEVVMGADNGINTNTHGVYGGVNFGLDKFDISRIAPRRAVAVTTPARTTLLSGGMLERQYPSAVAPLSGIVGAKPLSGLMTPMLSAAVPQMAAPLATQFPSTRVSMPGLMPSLSAAPGIEFTAGSLVAPSSSVVAGLSAIPRGVDLNLNQFSLDTPQELKEGHMLSEPQTADMCAAKADAFWSCLSDGNGSMCKADDLQLLKGIFNPNMSDRRVEGEIFAAPDTSLDYVDHLRSLVKAEEEIKQKRKDHFLSSQFSEENAGPLFPSSWTSTLEIARPRAFKKPAAALQPRENYVVEQQVLEATTPAFEKKTEDGTIFRIYRIGSMEVRTTREHDSEEAVGVVLAPRDNTERKPSRSATANEKLLKVTEYVERASQNTKQQNCSYYTVLETEHGSTIVTELCQDSVTWQENPVDLEERNSLAKVVRTASCLGSGMTVQLLKNHSNKALQQQPVAGASRSQTYATRAYTAAVGGVEAAMKATAKRQKEWGANDDDDDYELDPRVVEKVGPGLGMTLSPCTQCAKPFVKGYKSNKGWFCSGCWKATK